MQLALILVLVLLRFHRFRELSVQPPVVRKRKHHEELYSTGGGEDSDSENSDVKIGLHRSRHNDVSLTQVGIDHLKEDIGDLKEMLDQNPPPPKPRFSENQRQILELRNIVKGLKKELTERNHDRLYYESLVDQHVREIEELKEEIRRYKIPVEEFEEQESGRTFRNEDARRARGAFNTFRPGEYTNKRRRTERKDGWRGF